MISGLIEAGQKADKACRQRQRDEGLRCEVVDDGVCGADVEEREKDGRIGADETT